jgi:integrase
MSRLCKVLGERGLYEDPNTGVKYIRIQTGGRDTYKSLGTTRKTQAIDAIDARRAAKAAANLGIALEPDKEARSVTVAEVVKKYKADGYPDKKGCVRTEGSHKRNERDNCATLLRFFGDETLVDDLRPKLLNQYHAWRVENVTKGDGHRTTDLELNTLSNGLNWAVQEEMIAQNLVKFRVRFHSSTNARHCRDLAPADVDELHDIARLLFADKRSETIGWQALFEALTGLRTNEALGMRMDARPDEPGGLTADGGSLCVRRSKKAGRDNPYIEVHEGLRQLIKAHKMWHHRRYRKSPWYFPGRNNEDGKPVSKGALTRTLERFCKEKNAKKPHLKKKFTSHGLRAFYVLVRRSQGATDAQIAWEINHIGGVSTLGKVYGGVPPHWLQGKGPKLAWIPKGESAWSAIRKGRTSKQKTKGTRSRG